MSGKPPLGLQINDWFERYMFILVPGSLMLGVLFNEMLISSIWLIP
ncbi:hypothetical protein LQV63_18665 [Paenibacillus profundus]|uniref:Uncharacterized protein n=1 Tax=Paenibacillus profundus TaxID=1173085 RepID=A0ABS8YJH7_9BACL|nr:MULTISPECIES: hypothetical protein [Paenibacillus]MCE5171327.1 hypothetical protein [Paenibacillus profundus]MCM3340472.1 hypothetical protein [Paenibacillus sp. MER TA 81-3]